MNHALHNPSEGSPPAKGNFLSQWFRLKGEEFLTGIFDRALQQHCLEIIHPDGRRELLGSGTHLLPALQVNRPAFFQKTLLGSSVGFGEAYVDGDWDCHDLPTLLQGLAFEQPRGENWRHPFAQWALRKLRRFHDGRANTLDGSRENISEHYDLGNDFYKAWLDQGMVYSSALFAHPEQSLEDAQIHKIDALLDTLHLSAEHHLLEIGSGWGAAAIRAAQRFGCKVTSLTLSIEQKKEADLRIQALGLAGQVEILLTDYREMQGQFDRVLSIEMAEAVGHENLPVYFGTIQSLLKTNGLAAFQIITMSEERYTEYLKAPDWIQRHIFPGAVCPSIGALSEAISQNKGLQIERISNIAPHYAKTLRLWRERFVQAWREISPLGFDERFKRAWIYYLAYCEAGFASRRLGVHHILLSQPRNPDLRTLDRKHSIH